MPTHGTWKTIKFERAGNEVRRGRGDMYMMFVIDVIDNKIST